jgi:hypothetical protein
MADINKAHLEIWVVDTRGEARPLQHDDGRGRKTIEFPGGPGGGAAAGQAFANQKWEPGVHRFELRYFDSKGRLERTDTREFDENGQQTGAYTSTPEPEVT